MSKSIETCYKCMDDYCDQCTFANSCQECGEDTCGEEPCISECIIDGGCCELICKDCVKTHNCKEDDDE